MVGRGHLRPAEALRHLPNPGIVGSHDHLRQRLGLLAALDDVPDQRLAGNQRQRLPGEPRRTVARGDNADHFHRVLSTCRTRKLHGRKAACPETNAACDASNDMGMECGQVAARGAAPSSFPPPQPRLSYGSPMEILWRSYGNPMDQHGSPWLATGFQVACNWLSSRSMVALGSFGQPDWQWVSRPLPQSRADVPPAISACCSRTRQYSPTARRGCAGAFLD